MSQSWLAFPSTQRSFPCVDSSLLSFLESHFLDELVLSVRMPAAHVTTLSLQLLSLRPLFLAVSNLKTLLPCFSVTLVRFSFWPILPSDLVIQSSFPTRVCLFLHSPRVQSLFSFRTWSFSLRFWRKSVFFFLPLFEFNQLSLHFLLFSGPFLS